jgi:hypothetical protein
MTFNKLIAATACMTLLAFSGCKKDDDKSKTELLTSKTWVLKASVISPGIVGPGGATITDLYAQQEPCDKDDELRFKADKTYTEEEGAQKCNGTDPQVISTGNWNFNAAETVITQTPTGGTLSEANLIKLDGSTLQISVSQKQGTVTYTVTNTYSPK